MKLIDRHPPGRSGAALSGQQKTTDQTGFSIPPERLNTDPQVGCRLRAVNGDGVVASRSRNEIELLVHRDNHILRVWPASVFGYYDQESPDQLYKRATSCVVTGSISWTLIQRAGYGIWVPFSIVRWALVASSDVSVVVLFHFNLRSRKTEKRETRRSSSSLPITRSAHFQNSGRLSVRRERRLLFVSCAECESM